jgi:hypothetical protein
MKNKKLTIGMRCRFIPEKAKKHAWGEFAGHECLLEERSSGSFSVMVLGKGRNVKLKKKTHETVINQVAWVDEDELEHVDSKFTANLDFIDWYQENEEHFCGDCGHWHPDNGRYDPKTKEDYLCPNKKCPGNLVLNGICPYCNIKVVKDRCPKCKFNIEVGDWPN